jgi:hypothetical protein
MLRQIAGIIDLRRMSFTHQECDATNLIQEHGLDQGVGTYGTTQILIQQLWTLDLWPLL